MINLIQKRHADKGWAFFTELSNSTGGNVKGRADAFAVGIWPSRGYEAHCYECKASREDVKKELGDPTKADTVGRYADYFWLVVSDIKLVDSLVIPERWGILTPSTNGVVLRTVRKAPRQDAAPWSRGFCAALVRHVYDNHMPRKDANEIREALAKELRPQIEQQLGWAQRQLQQDHEKLRRQMDEFKAASGVDLDRESWRLGDVGAAVRLVVDIRLGGQAGADALTRLADAHERIARTAREAVAALTNKEVGHEVQGIREGVVPVVGED